MKKITLLPILFFYSFLAFSQTPCSDLSLLDCNEVEVTLPVNLNFDGNQGGILSTGFTMVDPPSTILTGDDDINDDDVPGLVAQNIYLSNGVLNVTATNGINYSQLSGSPNSTFTNSQINALGVGFKAASNVIDISAVIDQPNFTGSLNGTATNGSQQAGIWFGLNENNFAKLVVVKANATQQKIQFALEQTDPNNAANLIITELNTGNFNTSGVSQISFRISINPSDNSVRGFYSLDGGSEIQVAQSGINFLTAPTTFLNGIDHDNNIGTNNLTFAGIMTSTRRATGGSMDISYNSFSVTENITPFVAHINFQNNPSFTTPPIGYLADYGKAFGNSSVTIGTDNYEYGWKLASDGNTPIDISNEASNNGGSGAAGGAGRNRIAGTYSAATVQEKLEGTLMHFQGDNVMSNTGGTQPWGSQPRGNEAIWELEIPNGIYAVTIGLGDKDVNNLDSRHSATLEGYTVIPAFVPNPGQTVVETMIVEVSDGFLTMNGFGGFNSKITHIDVIESTGTPVNGVLAFSPNATSESIEAGGTSTFSSTLSGAGATNIGLTINDNINSVDKLNTGSNDWLTLPTTNTLGLFDFTIDATNLVENDTRNNKIIATAKGFIPAELNADLTATAVTVSEITAPFRMNVFGQDYTKDSDLYIAETPGYLVETQPTETSNTPYTIAGGHSELYHPRRFGSEFSYNFPIANGNYTIAIHSLENYFNTAGARIFDISIEGNTVISDLDLFATYGQGALGLLSFEVEVLDGELNIDFLASTNKAIVQAIEILPAAQSSEKDILTFALAEQTDEVTIDEGNHTVTIEVNNGTDITDLLPTITVSDNATINPASGVSNDFTNTANYTVTAEDGTTQVWSVNVTEVALINTAPQITSATTKEVVENQTAAIDVDATDDNDSEGSGLTFSFSGGNDDGQFNIDASTGVVSFVIAPDFKVPADSDADNIYDIQVTVTDSESLSITQDIAITVTDELEVPTNEFSYIENFTYSPGNLKVVSGGAWTPEVNNTSGIELPDAPVVAEGLTSGTTHSLNIENLNTTIDYITLINNPADLIANVPFYFGTYFKFSEIGTGNSNRIRVAIRVDDDAPGEQWIRQIIGRYDGNIKARLGLAGPNSNAGEQDLYEDQLLQFVVRGVWDGIGTITYQYTLSPTLTEGDNSWLTATTEHSTSGTPKLGRIFIGSTSANNTGKIGPIRLGTDYSEVVTELINNVPIASFTTSISDLTVNLDATSSQDDGSLTAYDWDFGNGDTANGETVSYGYPTAGTYTISLTVTDDQGLTSVPANHEVTVEAPLVVTSFPYNVNFQDAATTPPTGYVKDYGLPYGTNEGGLTYGWIKLSDGQPIDLTTPSNGVGRNRGTYPGLDLSQQTLVHMQGNHVGSWTGNRHNEGVWEIEVPNGWYKVSVSVGDPNQDGNLIETPDHFLSVEGITAIDIYDVDSNLPNGDPGRFSSGTVVVQVLDGKLTLDADNPLANNTKINSAVISEATDPRSIETDILTFVLSEDTATANIDTDNHSVTLEVPNGTGLTLTPTITLSDGATISPLSGISQDFSTQINYTVTAEDESTSQIWEVTITEASPPNSTPVVDNQSFAVAEDAALNSIVGTVVATDDGTVVYSITAGNESGTFAMDGTTGEITVLTSLDFETTNQYLLTVEVSDGELTDDAIVTIDISDVIEIEPCNPLSTLPCDQIVTTLPLNLAFDGSEGGLIDNNGNGTGFTMADSHSGNRLTEDLPISTSGVNGYEPSKLNIVNSNLVLTSSKGIAYVDNNAQVNTLGVGLQNISTPLTIETKLLGIVTGGGSAQAGIWFGADDENFVKLNVNGDNIEMRREIGGISLNGGTSPDQIALSNVGVSGNDVTLRLVIDPIASTLTAYYAIDNGTFVQLTKTNYDNLVLPQEYLDGKQLSIENGSASFAGVYTTYRNGTSFDTTFDYFSVSEENNPPVIVDQNFAVAEDATLNSVVGTVVATDEGSLTYAITAGNGGGVFAIDGSNGEITLLTALDYDTTPQYVLTIEVSDGTNNVSANITIDVNDGVEVLPCSPLSTLPCDQIETALPLSLDFTSDNGNLSQSGMTMVMEPSERLTEDVAIADPNVLGYAPSLISQSNLGLTLTSTKGIFYSQLASQGTPSRANTNSQMNALGVGLTTPTTTFSISSTLENPDFSGSTGNGAQQAGIWFGLDEDHYIKLALIKTGTTTTKKVQLQVENMDQNTTQTAFLELDTPNIGSNTGEITLRMELDPVNNTVRGYYTLEGGSEILISEEGVDFFPVPANYFAGTSYEIVNPSNTLNFAGIYTTHRNAPVDQSITVLFKAFEIDAEQPALALNFDATVLNFSGAAGENITPQTVTVTANSGNPTITLSDDPDAGGWLILPADPELGTLELGILPNLPVGNYSTTLFALDQPDMGYINAEMTINLEITEPINNFAVNVNFSDAASAAPSGYEKDAGDAYANRGNGYSYGWLDANTSAPADLTKNGRNREITGVSDLNNTLLHLQYGNVSANAANGYLPDAKWEIEVPNGSYLVTVFVGDPTVDNPAANIPAHRINAEGINLVDNYIPTGAIGSSTRFTSGSTTVNVTDGRLTIDPLNGGHNTKINSIQIVSTTTTIQTPRVAGVTPSDGAINISVTPTISANELFLPNFDDEGNAGVDNTTITTATVKLFKQGNTTPIGASVNGTGGGDAINLAPNQPLEANTTYILVIDGVLDLVGEPFEFFTSSFTTGSGNTGPVTDLDNVAFTNAGAVANNGGANGAGYSTLTIGPDGKLYGLVISGDIHRWTINADGTLANKEILNNWKSAEQGNYSSRTAVGLTFDPAATANNLIAYITHDSGGLNNAPAWDGKLSRLTGANLEVHDLILTNLPRSKKDHLTNSMVFKNGEPGVIYFNQGSNSAAGAPDNAWGNRKERLLSGAALRLDLAKLPEGQWPLNVKTTMDPVAINNVDVNSPTLASTVANYTEDGQTLADDGTYNPFYVNAPLTLFATGIRNAYDLVWHSNGQLYIPTNGTAGGSNAPASINGTRRPDGTFYDHSNPLYPVIPSSNGNNVQRDWLFRVDPNSPLGFYGHPNPLLGQFVLNRGDADVNNSAYNGVEADINYRGAAFDFEFNKSPNGVIEYRSNAENGNLQGALLVVRYSGSSDIIALVPDGPNGDILTYKTGIPGFTGFTDPLDLVEDVSNGNIYVSDYTRTEIVLLKPSNQAAPTPLIVLNTEEVTGDAIANSGTFTQEVLFSNLGNATLTNIQAELTGANAGEFSIVGMPSSINSQNSASFEVLFTPTSNGPKFAELTITGTDAEPVVIAINGLGKTGTGGNNEPSLQWILDTHLGAGSVNVGDTNVATNLIDLPNGSTYNDILGDEVAIEQFERAIDAPVTLELLSVYGPTTTNPVVAFGWYNSGNAASTTELFTVTNSPTSNGQTLNAPIAGVSEFDPGVESFGFYSRWPAFNNRQLFSEDALNTFTGAIPHHVRVYELPGESNAYIIATEEHISGFDYQDIVIIARNIRPFNSTPNEACSPISTLDCEELAVALPFSLALDGTEGALANTGFTMVDNPSARLAEDGAVYNANVPGFEPGQINFSNGNLLLTTNKGIAFSSNSSSTEVNSQINTLGVGIDAGDNGNFSITTTIINPYTDSTNNSEQAGIWFGLNEDNFVKLIANGASQIELRSEINAVSNNVDQVIEVVPNLNTSSVQLRLYVDTDNDQLVAFYSLNGGNETQLGSLPLPAAYLSGNANYDNLSFAGIFATKRREAAATEVVYTISDFAITPDNIPVVFEPININFSLPEDVPPTGYLVDSGLGFGDRGNTYSYGWLTTNGLAPLDLSANTRNRNVDNVDILRNTLLHMQYGNVGGTTGVLTEGIWEIEVPNGNYIVSVGVGDPNLDAKAGTEPFHSINIEGINAIDRYSPTGAVGASTRFTSGSATVTVTDGRLTIDASGGFNTKINSMTITQDGTITQPFFANVTPGNNSTNVAIENFQINVEVITPLGYELDKATLAGNINLYEVTNAGEVLVPSNSNDTGGGDAITLTPLSSLKTFTTYTFRLTSDIEANVVGDINDRLSFLPFESQFTTGDENVVVDLDLSGVEFFKVEGGPQLGEGTTNQRFSSLVIGPDGKLYASTIGNFNSDGKIYRWDMATDGTLQNLEILSPELLGAAHPISGPRNNNDRLIIGLVFDPASTADNLIAYVTHSAASITDGPEWDGILSKLTGPTLSNVEDLIIHLPRSGKDHLTNSIVFDPQGNMYINQGSNSAGGEPDPNWVNRPERLLSASVLKVDFNKMPSILPLSVYTTDNIGIINSASAASLTMSDGTYNPYATNAPLTIYATGIRNAYDLVWHSNGWLYIPTNGTAGNNNNSPNSPSTANYDLARRIDGLTTIPFAPALNGGETQKDWLFKTQGGSYHGHPNPYRGEFVLNHGGAPYSGLPGQEETSYTDVAKYPDNLGPDPNYREPAYDFGKNKSPNGAIEYQSNAFGGKLKGLLMVVRFSGQDDLLVMQPKPDGDIANANGDVTGLGGFDDPLDVVEDPRTGNMYISEYDRDNNGTPKLTLLRATVPAILGPEIAATPDELIFEMTVNNEGSNTDTKVVTITNNGNAVLNISSASITGAFADQFESVLPSGTITLNPGENQDYTVTFAPDLDGSNLGYQQASLTIESNDAVNPTFEVGLHGLKKAGFEGGQEPALQDVVDALGIGINVGWTSLSSSTNPNPVGDEVEVELWVKASDAPINITPVGRYSPAEELPFGWYTNDGSVTHYEVGVLAGGIANAQTLFPPVATGDSSFDPQGSVFGFYVESETFGRFNYSEDAINTGIAHRTRIYPVLDRTGNLIENSYLITFEDATNGDYQDYMFIIDNVFPFEDGTLVLNFDEQEVAFNAAMNQEDVPVQQLTLFGNGGVTAGQINLSASEDWVVLPTDFELNSPFDLGIDTSGLPLGTYEATITATAPNYLDAVINVSLKITNELVYTYQFNFQDPDDIETSPAGYIDDLGMPYGTQSTSLGDMTFGWVDPGTFIPADASANARNRNNGTNDDALLKTFTIMGHSSSATYPQLDWIVNVPNGTYSVNISVGDPDYTDSNHVLDVNEVTIVDYNQENIAPDDYSNLEETKLVDVIDGTLRLSLGTGGANAKPNYIRLAPFDASLVPPTIVANFDGNISDTDTYRGSLQVSLEAIDESNSGGIARLEYTLDDNAVESYAQPFDVVTEGAHTLVVTAEDNNGNTSEKTYNFIIETPTGALLSMENMTKVPGTNRGFPADDYYTFHRLGSPGQALVHDTNVMRLNNTGTGDLVVTAINLSDSNDYTFELLDAIGTTATLPINIAAGSYADLDITFIGTTGTGSNGIFVESIEVVSNADNALENKATLHGAYSPQPEGGDEINAQEVFDAFGFQTSMLSIVNDEGTIVPPNTKTTNPSSNYPIPENIEAGYEGDMILSSNFVQADPSKPVIGIQLSALHGGPSSNGSQFVAVNGTSTVGGMNFSHNASYYQTLLPKNNAGAISFDTANSISGAFRIAVSGYLTSGGNNINGNRPDLLGARVYKAIDHNGNVIPNEYIVLQDFVQGGCGAGSANCDWNDNTFYFINIRPEGVPSAQPIEDLLVNVDELFNVEINQYFDNGYPGNTLEITATINGSALPSWMSFNTNTGEIQGTVPTGTTGSFPIVLEAKDANGLSASTTLVVNINEPPVAVDDEAVTEKNLAINLDQLLSNDSEPNGEDVLIVSVDTPQNGTAELNSEGTEVLYTPNNDYFGPDSFTYTIEDESGLTATANVLITVNEENQAPLAIISTNVNEGPAALVVSFNGSGSTDDKNDIAGYLWDFGDGSVNSNEMITEHTYTSAGVYTASLSVTDSEGLSNTATVTITVSTPPNTNPVAVATVTRGASALQFNFSGSASNDGEGDLTYAWDFGDGTPVATAVSPTHTYAASGIYTVKLTVTDEGGLTDIATINVDTEEPVIGDFALRINAGGPEINYDGNVFSADQNFVGGKAYTNTSATVPALYQTERSASPPTFGYEIPLPNGEYRVTLHFAEIFFGANGGGTLGTAQRIFDVVMEGSTILDDFDINAAVGPQTITTRTFDVVVEDGILNLGFDATAPDGVNQPKLSAIEIFGLTDPNIAPTAVATATPLNGTAPLQVNFTGSGSSDQETPDALTYAWDFGNGDSSSATNPVYTYTTVGSFTATLTVTDPEGLQDTATVTITVDEEVVVDCTPVPSPWTNSDIGNVAANGEACFDNGRFEVNASGADIFGSADEFHYVYQELQGDGEIIAQLMSLEQTNGWAKAGVMMRSDLDA
ncbi:PKD domain-containing protein, partial [Arenibacter sp. F26102]|uniref:PKD domain-containing protein n=1 Tax=Arenibacter sp. F26102 TaxID=2926416 RepID=UPI001FF51BF4